MLIKRTYGHIAFAIAFSVGLLLSGMVQNQALAYAPEGDLMKVKGYSPELIQLTSGQRSRQEWKQAAPPKKSPTERFMHNIYYGEWINNVDEFGAQVIRDH
jgi:hypothetical protein